MPNDHDDVCAQQTDGERKKRVKSLRKEAAKAYAEKNYFMVFKLTAQAKRLKAPVPGIDYLRALAWLESGQIHDAYEALKEELRWFPDNARATELLREVQGKIAGSGTFRHDVKFMELYSEIRPYTMLSDKRLYALYAHAVAVCAKGIAGNFVECGVAGGGSSGLISRVIADLASDGSVTLFSCDSFSGMPEPGEHDTHEGVKANDTGWGAGTCSAPEDSVLSLCAKLGSTKHIRLVKGYFEDTLKEVKKEMSPIAFLHMDGDWYQSTRTILEELYDELLPGAYVQIDDYGHWDGCRQAVHEFEGKRKLRFSFTPIDEAGVSFFKP